MLAHKRRVATVARLELNERHRALLRRNLVRVHADALNLRLDAKTRGTASQVLRDFHAARVKVAEDEYRLHRARLQPLDHLLKDVCGLEPLTGPQRNVQPVFQGLENAHQSVLLEPNLDVVVRVRRFVPLALGLNDAQVLVGSLTVHDHLRQHAAHCLVDEQAECLFVRSVVALDVDAVFLRVGLNARQEVIEHPVSQRVLVTGRIRVTLQDEFSNEGSHVHHCSTSVNKLGQTSYSNLQWSQEPGCGLWQGPGGSACTTVN